MQNYPPEKPRDESGTTIPHDNEGIGDPEFLIRGITRHSIRNNRVSKSLFKSSSDPYRGLSVDLERISGGINYQSGQFVGAVKFKAEVARGQQLLVGYDPIHGVNLAHSQVWNSPNPQPRSIGASATKRICTESIWHQSIPNVSLASY